MHSFSPLKKVVPNIVFTFINFIIRTFGPSLVGEA